MFVDVYPPSYYLFSVCSSYLSFLFLLSSFLGVIWAIVILSPSAGSPVPSGSWQLPCALSPEAWGCTRLRLSHLQSQSGRKPRPCPCFSKARRSRPILEEELQDLLGPPSAPERRLVPACTGFGPGDPEGHTASGRGLAPSRPCPESWLPPPGCLRTRTSRVFRRCSRPRAGF